MENQEKEKIRAKRLGKPIYKLGHEKINNRYVLVAEEIGKNGNSENITAIFLVTEISEYGKQKHFYPDDMGHPSIRYNVSDLEEAIAEVERTLPPVEDMYVNAFRINRWAGERKNNCFMVPVEFYQIEVDKEKDLRR